MVRLVIWDAFAQDQPLLLSTKKLLGGQCLQGGSTILPQAYLHFKTVSVQVYFSWIITMQYKIEAETTATEFYMNICIHVGMLVARVKSKLISTDCIFLFYMILFQGKYKSSYVSKCIICVVKHLANSMMFSLTLCRWWCMFSFP